ncbi:MAG: iron-sulfur cluster repair di-iron protein [Acidobacteria bacterium]|nr:iron-sulfur cluster repair di-iron protein [Acidobacteriota bacterium]
MRDTAVNESFATKSVGEIVAEDWRAAAVFERFGIDFCCGGRRSVADACRSAGIDVAAVERAVEALPPVEPGDHVSQLPVDRLIDHILLTHHAYVRAALPRIVSYLAKLIQVHGGRHPELSRIAATFDGLGDELLQHMRKEEHVLFPYIQELFDEEGPIACPFGTVENPIRMMEREHDAAGVQLHELRTLTGNYTPPPDGCATYRVCFEELAEFDRDLHRHIHLENNVLFPKAVELEASRN